MAERNQGQEALLFTMMGEFIPGGFFVYHADEEERVTYSNRRLLEIFGCSGTDEFIELTGGTFKGMVHPDDYKRVSKTINRQITEGSDQRDFCEYRIIRKDGSERRVIDYGMWIDNLGDGPCYSVFIEDVTDKYW